MSSVLRRLVLIASISYVLLFLVLVSLRLRYPYELEWLEGASVDHVRTILAGRPLYAQPSLRFTPLTYTPAYFYLGAALSSVLGVGFVPLRLISVVAAVALLAITFRLASREADDALAGWLAVGLFTATFGWTSGWLDLGRTDSLFLFLATAAVYVLRWHDSTRAIVASGVLISLAFLTKQTALIIAGPLSLACALKGWRAFALFTLTVAFIVGATTIAFERLFDGWYLYYLFSVPEQHPIQFQSIAGFWRHDLLTPFPVALTVSGVYLVWRLTRQDRQVTAFYLLVSGGFVIGAWVSRLHSLSFINVVLPAYLALALVFAIAVHDMIQRAGRSNVPRAHLVVSALYALCFVQLARLLYSPAALVPAAEDVAAGRVLVQAVAETPGTVFLPYHGYLPALAGKETYAHAVVLADVIRGGRTEVERGLDRELVDALRSHRFDCIVMAETPMPVRAWLPIDQYYRPETTIVSRQSRFWRPEVRYVPR